MTDRVPRPQTTQAATQTGPPLRDYRDELKAQIALAELAEQHHNEAIGQLREQAAGREANLKRLLAESSAALKAQEREVMNLQVAITEAKERFIKEEERNSRRELYQFEENEELRSQNRELQQMASQHLQMWRISEEQRETISASYNHLQVEAIVDVERERDAWIKELDERASQLTKRYEQSLELVTTKAKNTQTTCELIVRKCEEDAKTARAELELC